VVCFKGLMGRATFQGLLLSCMLLPGRGMTSMSVRRHFMEASAHRVPEPLHCAELTNQGTHSTVQVSVGTPQQRFDLVADTGSNAVIVLSCICVDKGRCSSGDDCFRGQDESSTFRMGRWTGLAEDGEQRVTMTFGSGDIQADIATDEVSVGGARAYMENGVLLMVDRALNIDGPFEGILGLGRPARDGLGVGSLRESAARLKRGGHYVPPGFPTEAGISRFSLCFKNNANGALRLGTDETLDMQEKLGSFGEAHWDVGLTGVYVGATKVQLDMCRRGYDDGGNVPDPYGQACGGIPDSGTTAILAPEASLEALFESICDQWDRCGVAAEEKHLPKAQAFVDVLSDCGSWLDDEHSDGLSELPPLHFRVQGSRNGQVRDLELAGWFYVFEVLEEQYELVSENFRAFVPQRAAHRPPIAGRRTCAPAFSATHGSAVGRDTWILGTPFFYAYDVRFDLSDASLSFENGTQCGSCDEGAVLARTDALTLARSPRQVFGPWRSQHFNASGAM